MIHEGMTNTLALKHWVNENSPDLVADQRNKARDALLLDINPGLSHGDINL